jgi:hypothetical protein
VPRAPRRNGCYDDGGRTIRTRSATNVARTIWPLTLLSNGSFNERAMPSADTEIYAALTCAFGALGIRWYVFGAQAAILYGAVRFTEDVDVTVEIANRSHHVLVDALKLQGFELRVDDESFIEQTRVLPLFHRPTETPVDIVLAGPGIEELFLEGRVEIDVDGIMVPVARAEDIAVMKILSARTKDLEDVVAIIRTQGSSFDDNRVRWLLGLLEQALGQSDLLPIFERYRQRAR